MLRIEFLNSFDMKHSNGMYQHEFNLIMEISNLKSSKYITQHIDINNYHTVSNLLDCEEDEKETIQNYLNEKFPNIWDDFQEKLDQHLDIFEYNTSDELKIIEENDEDEIVERKEGYEQVAVMTGLLVDDVEDFEKTMLEHFNTKVQYLETIKTKPDVGDITGETGGRSDVFIAVHNDDIPKFSIARLTCGIRWIEDVLSSNNSYHRNPIYPPKVFKYKTWEA